MKENKFESFPISSIEITAVTYARGRIFIETKSKLFYVAKNAVSRLAKALGVKKRELLSIVKNNPEKLKELLEKNRKIVLMAFRSAKESGIWVIYNVATEKFTPIRHRDVRAAAEVALKELGVEPKVLTKKFERRFVYYFVVSTHRIGNVTVSVEVAVSNANTVKDAIHVYPHIVVSVGSKRADMYGEVFAKSRRVLHVGDPAEILERVKAAVKEVYADIKRNEHTIVTSIATVASTPITNPKTYIYNILSALKLPKKYVAKMSSSLNEFGRYQQATVFDVISFLSKLYLLVVDTNDALARRIMNEIKKLTASAITSATAVRVK